MPKKAFFLTLLLSVAFAYADQGSKDSLERGIALFEGERYKEAIEIFGALLADPRAKEERAEASYWACLAYLAAGEYAAAERAIESFLSLFPNHPRVPDILYQRGRLAFSKAAYESALGYFASFMTAAPKHELYPSALYWSGECLYSLGRLDEAEQAFSAVIDNFPKSVKMEAASYRKSLINLEFRQEELLKLLTWSHEESLRVAEDFRRRERAYEQALSVYQKQIAEAKRGVAGAVERELVDLRGQVADLTKRIVTADADLASARSEMATLKGKLLETQAALKAAEKVQAAPGPSLSPELASSSSSSVIVAEALAAKTRALNLLAFYLERISGGAK